MTEYIPDPKRYFLATTEETINDYTMDKISFVNNSEHPIETLTMDRGSADLEVPPIAYAEKIADGLTNGLAIKNVYNIPSKSAEEIDRLHNWEHDWSNGWHLFIKTEKKYFYVRFLMYKWSFMDNPKIDSIPVTGKEGRILYPMTLEEIIPRNVLEGISKD